MEGDPWEFPTSPNAILGRGFWPTGPPFGICPVAPDALITTDGFLPCSLEKPFVLVLGMPDWAPTVGDDEAIGLFMSVEESWFILPFCTGAEAPVVDMFSVAAFVCDFVALA